MNTLNDQQLNNVSGGGANGNFWQEGAAIYYRVVGGDTLSQIALRAQVPMSQILALNPAIKNPDLIRVGQVLRIR
ncbi:MAG: LysM peptidoglycan-binding domain-containing protein [Oscillospiraceae bacterium]|nr:LysM peptidoglycan-binding domain-containing protein [Oscillospiraceae bacterium]